MRNIIKSLNYQSKKDILNIIILGIGIFALLMTLFIDDSGVDELNGGMVFVKIGELIATILPIVILVCTSRITGWDRNDKTMNYEILSGHKRTDVILARLITSIMWCTGFAVILLIVPVVIGTVIYGWGVNAPVNAVFVRILLAFVVMLRMITFMVLVAVVMDNCFIAMMIGFAVYYASTFVALILEVVSKSKLTYILASNNLNMLLITDNSIPKIIDGNTVIYYQAEIGGGEIIKTLIASFLMIGIYTYLSFRHFKRKDVS